MKLNPILVPLFLLFTAVSADAMVLRGVVSEVRDGQSIVVMSGGRKLNVILKGVDAPELNQEFGDVSRKHLASLILDQAVEVHFSQLQNEQVIARVIFNQLDVGLQVIRDGAAWFDKVNNHSLTDEERALYSDAERIARAEMRGLWSDGSPMPPWEWKRAQEARLEVPVLKTYKPRPAKALESEDIVLSKRAAVSAKPHDSKVGSPTPKPSARPLNMPGQDFDFKSYFTTERISIVYFYADWCPACRSLNPVMDAINAQVPDMQVMFMNIGEWDTPVTRLYGVSSVPHLKIYDKNGSLLAEGRAAKTWLLQAMDERARKK